MSNPYSDKRWSDAPKPVNSECNSCKYHYGFGKCEKHPEGIPKEKLKQSFPGTGNYNKKILRTQEQISTQPGAYLIAKNMDSSIV